MKYGISNFDHAGGGIQLMTASLLCTEPFIITLLSSQYDLKKLKGMQEPNHPYHVFFRFVFSSMP